VTLIPGDGTGPEICDALRGILKAAGVDIAWDLQPMTDGTITPELLASARKNGTVLMGYQVGPRDEAERLPPVAELRRELGLFVNHRPVKTLPGLPARFHGVDLLVVRETTEDIYAHLEHESLPGVYESFKVTTLAACERITRHAFEVARQLGRKKVTLVHKANILKKSDGMFLRVGRKISEEYPDIKQDDCIVDALCMKLTVDPTWFDILVCGNLYGDIVADLASGLAGGRSNSPSINLGDNIALFTAGHGDPLDHAGTGNANPLGMLFSSICMLRHLGEGEAADHLMKACEQTLVGGTQPVAIGGGASCAAFIAAVTAAL